MSQLTQVRRLAVIPILKILIWKWKKKLASATRKFHKRDPRRYAVELLADEEWLKNYEIKEEENKKLEHALQGVG